MYNKYAIAEYHYCVLFRLIGFIEFVSIMNCFDVCRDTELVLQHEIDVSIRVDSWKIEVLLDRGFLRGELKR